MFTKKKTTSKENIGRQLRPKRPAMKEGTLFWLFCSPWVIGFAMLTLLPMLSSLYISFTEWNILSDPLWVGLDNYKDVFSDPLVWKSLKVTLVYCLITVPLNVILTLLIAVLLNSDLKYAALLRTLYYLPCVVSGVASAMLWNWVFNYRYGLVNQFLEKLGLQGPKWLQSEQWALYVLIFMGLWGLGGGITMYLAGLQAVPRNLQEVAILSGASWWSRMRYITIPSMSPILLFSVLTGIIGGLQSFVASYLITAGGPNNATLFYALYLYNNAFAYRKMGKACAMAWIMFVIIFILSRLVLKVSRKMVYYENDEGGEL